MLELYNFSQSTCSLKVRIALAEKGLEWVDRRLVSKDNEHLSDWYLKLNPNGVVPTLVHDGVPIIESSVILQYLEDVFPEMPLSPRDPVGLARLRAWLAFVDAVPTPAVRYPSFHHGGLIRKFQSLTPEEFAETAKRRPLKRAFYEKMGQTGFSNEDLERANEDIRKTAARMDRMLAEGGPWLLGERYTIGDIAVAPLMDRMEDMGFAYLWEESFPRVAEWLGRMQARPAYRTAYYKGSRLSDQYPDLKLGKGARRSDGAASAPSAAPAG
jgi:glutathione S-transferase